MFVFSDTFTDSAIGSTRVNGDHKEKVLQRWDGGDSNGENFDLDADAVSSTHMLVYIQSSMITNECFLGWRFHMIEAPFLTFSLMAGMPARCSALMRRPMG